jgi:hypothetical protein
MFVNNQVGALAAAHYYLEARRWTIATLDAKPFLVVCDAAKCRNDAPTYAGFKSLGQHVVRGREVAQSAQIFNAPKGNRARWVVETAIAVAAGKLVDSHGRTVRAQAASSQRIDIYVRWSGKMWRVSDVFLAG